MNLLLISCQTKNNEEKPKVFVKLDSTQTHVLFNNRIVETDSLNILDYLYFYNGAGVASADFNNDGLQDLFFVSNQGENKLYVNKGGLNFEDITKKAGLGGYQNLWRSGVTIIDINNDGFKDIYISVVSGYKGFKGSNLLFLNNRNLTFTECAKKWDIDFAGLSTQASFFDYDKDGDLDLLILAHSVHSNNTYGDSTLRYKYNEIAGEHLFRNDENKFTEVNKQSGIYAAPIGYGLGMSIADLNNDGWDDIYISNDFFEQDYYYINQHNGTFKESLKKSFGHTSLFSMGNTLNDINKDGMVDVISADMLPEDMHALKSTMNDESLDIYNQEINSGYYYQYSKNCLQLNVGNGDKFVDIGFYAGISATDWTWSPLVEDFDLDGRKDIFFSNGIKKRLNDLDYLKYLGDHNVFKNFSSSKKFDRNKIEMMPDGKVHNYLFQGDSLLKFTDISSSNDMQDVSSSHGAIMVDLDNDGDKEIVTNNINKAAFIYKNNSIEQDHLKKLKHLSINVKYKIPNIDGIGTKVFLKSNKTVDHQEIQTSTAFESTQNTSLTFAFNVQEEPKEMLIIWPDNSYQIINQFNINKRELIKYDANNVQKPVENTRQLISNFIKPVAQFKYKKVKAQQIAKVQIYPTLDFNYNYLLPHTYLPQPPPIAVGDINEDGYDDIYVGGISGQEKYFLMGNKNGTFTKGKIFFNHLKDADRYVKLVDLNQDGKLDLIVTSAENPFAESKDIKPIKVWMNLGKGNFERINMPNTHSLSSKIAVIDINGDNKPDIFLAGAVSFRNYTQTLPSYIFLNKGKNEFVLASKDQFQELQTIPFIKSIDVKDVNDDGKQDLLIASEWQPLKIFLNSSNGLKEWSSTSLAQLKGWWQSISVSDIDGDGKLDLIAGNWGQNNKLNVKQNQPLSLYNSDLDDDGRNDLILSYYFKGKAYPFRPKNDLETELPYLKKKWLSYREMADKTTDVIFGDKLNEKNKLIANTFNSVFISDFLNANKIEPLPYLYQQAPIISMLNNASNQLIVNGNFWGAIPYEGKYDALGLATLTYDKKSNQIAAPIYWVNSLINFNEIDDFYLLKEGKEIKYLALTNEGRIILISDDAP
ncbi:MAG: VCBS repeat-containing protein [Sphingobacteriales bacterium]|nr:VCBS repeat-containing protein [Sphingobacteriales bacterium]